MTEPVIVLDAGAVDRVASDKDFRALLSELIASGWEPVIPTVVLAEASSGRPEDARLNQVVKRFGTVSTTQATARRAGQLRYAVSRTGGGRLPSGIDAIVAAHAADAGVGVVFTTDPADLRRLLADFPNVQVAKP